ncbi:hypothetical protein [Richelia sinica]|uniref:hypothetical protein n=1 Tax=Richelia sinica TaxID=1357545 RepID=UPI001683D86F|nr:hypothetical protein [Richelia sinica]MBD2663305.1 hypothetical protein [Richelia sinica FACHB-800]
MNRNLPFSSFSHSHYLGYGKTLCSNCCYRWRLVKKYVQKSEDGGFLSWDFGEKMAVCLGFIPSRQEKGAFH